MRTLWRYVDPTYPYRAEKTLGARAATTGDPDAWMIAPTAAGCQTLALRMVPVLVVIGFGADRWATRQSFMWDLIGALFVIILVLFLVGVLASYRLTYQLVRRKQWERLYFNTSGLRILGRSFRYAFGRRPRLDQERLRR